MRRLLAIAAAAAAALAAAPSADAALSFRPCAEEVDLLGEFGVECASLRVPLDRSGEIGGSVRLHVERVRAFRTRRGVIVALAGGPGQSAASYTQEFGLLLERALDRRDLVVFDQRGTGRSGLLRCRALERADLLDAGAEAAACAEGLGPRRAHYTTRDSVADLEALREALGAERITLYGVSYGTKLALAYARARPGRVERLVLDSVVDTAGPDALYRETFAAVPRVLRALCRRGCRDVTADPVADLRELVARLGSAPMTGRVVGRGGRARSARLTALDVFTALIAGDTEPTLRVRFPAAVRAALDGDAAPMLRLAARASAVETPSESPRAFSTAVYAATVCEETALPWERTAPPAQRPAQAAAFAAGLPDSAFDPFDRATALASDVLRLCSAWPAAPSEPALASGPLPDVPMLLLEGEDDLRTPAETAERVAAQAPRATVVTVPLTGHGALGGDLAGCADRALARFFAGRSGATGCRARPAAFERPTAVPPRSLADVEPVRGLPRRIGQTANAVALTLQDAIYEMAVGAFGLFSSDRAIVFGGLRGGRLHFGLRAVRLDGFSYVPGVRISTRQLVPDRGDAVIRVHGPAAVRGTLRLTQRGTLHGRLGGRRVRIRSGLFQTSAARRPVSAVSALRR